MPEESGTGGVTGLGLPAGSTGASASTGTTTTTTTGTTGQPSPTPGGTGTTGGAAAPSPANVTTTDMLSPTDNNQRKPPTRMEPIQGQIAVNQGFSLGTAQGQVLVVDPSANQGVPSPVIMRALPNSAFNETLTNPWDLSSDGSQNLIITDGIGISGQPGRVIRVSNITITASTSSTVGSANGTFSLATASTTNSTPIFNPLFVEPIGGGIIFVSEYIASPQGTVRRIDLATGNVTTVINGLNFPAGLAADLTNGFLYVCQNAAANGGPNGSIIRVNLSAINNAANGTIPPVGPNDAANVAVITPASGQPAFNRPWECHVDGAGGLVTAEGNALGSVVQGAPGPGGLAQGAIRYVPRNTTVAQAILSGLNNCAGLSIQGTIGSLDQIFFVEAASNPNGTVRSLQFDIGSFLIPNGGSLSYGTGFNNPIDTLPSTSSNGLPLKAAINFFGGAANQGRVVDFR